jgi:hypothetical protein
MGDRGKRKLFAFLDYDSVPWDVQMYDLDGFETAGCSAAGKIARDGTARH